MVQGLIVKSLSFFIWGQELKQYLPLGVTEHLLYFSCSLNGEPSAEEWDVSVCSALPQINISLKTFPQVHHWGSAVRAEGWELGLTTFKGGLWGKLPFWVPEVSVQGNSDCWPKQELWLVLNRHREQICGCQVGGMRERKWIGSLD